MDKYAISLIATWKPFVRAMKPKTMRNQNHLYQRQSRSRLSFGSRSYSVAFHRILIGCLSLTLVFVGGQPAHAQLLEGKRLDEIRSAAERGDAQAQYELGRAYEDGIGVQADSKQAVKWYGKAAEQHFSMAQYLLGNILLYGEGGVAPDYTLAQKWLEEAARAGIPAAQRDLGTMYEQGLGGKPDPIWAWVWYDFAATRGDGKANELRDELSRRLDPRALAEARRLAADIAPTVAPPPERNPAH
jgi:TPR repeat protein